MKNISILPIVGVGVRLAEENGIVEDTLDGLILDDNTTDEVELTGEGDADEVGRMVLL